MFTDLDNRQFLSLITLGIGTFAIGTDAFIVAGLLQNIASDLKITPALAGQLITIFSLSYAIIAPISASLLGRLSRNKILQIASVIFIIGNIISAVSPNFTTIILSRVIAAFGAATFTPQASAVATEMVPEHKKGIALSIVYGGMTVAIALGIPLGTAIGDMFGWRISFIGVAILGSITFLGSAQLLPAMDSPGRVSIKERLSAVKNKEVLLILLITLFAGTSEHALFSYISIVLENTFISNYSILPVALLFFGIGAVIGNFVSGYGTDRFGSKIILLVSISTQTVTLLLFSLFYLNPITVCFLVLIWGITGWMYLVPIQYRLFSLSKKYGVFTVSLNSSILYLGIALGGIFGGMFIANIKILRLGIFSATCGIIAIIITYMSYKEK